MIELTPSVQSQLPCPGPFPLPPSFLHLIQFLLFNTVFFPSAYMLHVACWEVSIIFLTSFTHSVHLLASKCYTVLGLGSPFSSSLSVTNLSMNGIYGKDIARNDLLFRSFLSHHPLAPPPSLSLSTISEMGFSLKHDDSPTSPPSKHSPGKFLSYIFYVSTHTCTCTHCSHSQCVL